MPPRDTLECMNSSCPYDKKKTHIVCKMAQHKPKILKVKSELFVGGENHLGCQDVHC